MARGPSPNTALQAKAGEIIARFTDEIVNLNSEAANIVATAARGHLADDARRNLLQRAIAVTNIATRLEGRLDAALVGQPVELREHSRIMDCRAAIVAVRVRLNAVGG